MKRSKKYGGFLDSLCEFYSEVLIQTSISKQLTHFRNLFVILVIIIYTFNAFFASPNMTSVSGAYFYNFIKYIRFGSLEQMSGGVYSIIRLVVAVILLVNFITLIVLVRLKSQSAFWDKMRSGYFIFNVIINHILFIPLMELLIKKVFEVGHFASGFDPIDAVCIISFIAMTVQGLQLTYFFQYEFLQKKNYGAFPNPNTIIGMYIAVIVIGLECMVDYANIGFAALIIFAVLTGIQAVLGFFFLTRSYISDHEDIQSSLFFLYILYFAEVAALLTSLALPSVNFIPIFICSIFLGFIYAWQRNKLKLQSRMNIEITSISLAIIKLDFITKLGKKCILSSGSASFQASVQLKGLLKEHEYNCTNVNCECHEASMGELSESRTLTARNTQRLKETLKNFVKNLLVQNLRELIAKSPDNFYYRYLLGIFYLRRIKNRVMANLCAIELSSMSLGAREEVRLLALRKNIHHVQRNINIEQFKNKDFEDLVEIEEKYEKTLTLVIEIFNKMISFWQNDVRSQSIDNNSLFRKGTHILDLKARLKEITRAFKDYELHNDYLVLLMDFIRKEIFNAKIQLKYDEQSFKDSKSVSLVFEQNAQVLTDKFYSKFVQKSGVVVVVGFNQSNIGRIMRSSDGIRNIFGYEKQEVLGKNINILMPQEMSEVHDGILSRVFQTGKFQKKIHELNSFGIRKGGEPVRVKIMFKMNIGLDSTAELIGLIVPTVPDAEERFYMLCDNNGFVMHASNPLIELLNISAEKVEERLFNIGMLNINLLEYLPVKLTVFASSMPLLNSGLSLVQQPEKNDQKIFAISNFESVEDAEQLEKLFMTLHKVQPEFLNSIKSGKTAVKFNDISQVFEVYSLREQGEDSYVETSPNPSHRSNIMNTRGSVDEDFVLKRLTSFGKVLFNLMKTKKQECSIKSCQATIEYEMIEVHGKNVMHMFSFQKMIDLKKKQRMSGISKRQSLANKNSINCLESPKKVSQTVNESSLNSARKASENGINREAEITSLFKRPQNLFFKEANQIPSKNYGKIRLIFGFMAALIAYIVIIEIVYLTNFKQPLLNCITPIKEEYRLMSDFDSNIKSTYNFLLNRRLPDFSFNSTMVFENKVKKAKALMLQSEIRKHVFNPVYNPLFNVTYLFDVKFNTNYAFLVENFMFEMMSYIYNTENITSFGESLHEVYVQRFNLNLFPFLSAIQTNIQANFWRDLTSQLDSYLLIVLGLLASFAVLAIIISAYQLRVMRNILKIADPFLYIEDKRIDQIVAYYNMAAQYFKKRFDPQAEAESFLMQDRSMVASQPNLNEKRRQWKNKNSLSWTFLFVYFCLSAMSVGLFCCVYFLANNWQLSLMRSLLDLQKDGIKILNDRNGLISLTMHAKDYYLYPRSFENLNETYVERLKNLIFLSGSFSDDSEFSDASLSQLYKQSFCSHVNQTQMLFNSSCSDIYTNILLNNVPTIKNILGSKLNFIFKNESFQVYNYTSWHAQELDRLSLFIENGLNTIYAHWQTAFANKVNSISTIQRLISAIICLVAVGILGIYLMVGIARLNRNYRRARKLFLHLIPDDTLYKNKMIKVQLSKAGIVESS